MDFQDWISINAMHFPWISTQIPGRYFSNFTHMEYCDHFWHDEHPECNCGTEISLTDVKYIAHVVLINVLLL